MKPDLINNPTGEDLLISKEILNSLSNIIQQFKKNGLSQQEISDFVSKSLSGKDIYTARYYYDYENGRYYFESTFPAGFKNLVNTENKGEKLIQFSFNGDKTEIDLLREFVIFKRKSNPVFYHYNQSDAFGEGIELITALEIIPPRPEKNIFPTTRGTTGKLNGKEKIKTSFALTPKIRDLLYDVIYFRKISSDKNYNKQKLLIEIVEKLETKYHFQEKK